MKTKIFLTLTTCLALALAVTASGTHLNTRYEQNGSLVKDTTGDKKTDGDSLPIPAPGQSPGKLDSTPFPQDTPRPVDPTPTPKPADPPVPQPVQPEVADTTAAD